MDDLALAIAKMLNLGSDPVAMSFENRVLEGDETVQSVGLVEGDTLTAIFKGGPRQAAPVAGSLNIAVVQMSGQLLANLTPGPQNTINDLIAALTQAAGVDGEAQLMLTCKNRVLQGTATLEEECVNDGDLLTAIRYPELFIASAYEDGNVRLWSAETGRCERIFDSSHGSVLTVDMSSDGMLMVTGCMDGGAHLWSVTTGAVENSFYGHQGPVVAVACSADGTTLATGSFDRNAQLWDMVSGEVKRKLTGHRGTVCTVSFSPDGSYLGTGSEDGAAKLWRTDIKDPLGEVTLLGHRGCVTSVKFSPDNTLVATASVDCLAKIWQVETGSNLFALKGHRGGVTSVAFSPDGALLASGSQDSTVRLWSVLEGHCVSILKGHNLALKVRTVAFSPAGSLLATGGDDGTVRLWSVAAGEQKSILKPAGVEPQDRPAVKQVAFLCGPLKSG